MTQNDPLVNRLQFKNLSIFKTFFQNIFITLDYFPNPVLPT